MLTLSVYPAGFGEISGSPFCVKAWCLLEQSGVPYDIHFAPNPSKAPKRKFPVLQDGDLTIPDSDQIRMHLETKYDVDFDAGLSTKQKAISRAIIRLCEEHLYFAIVSTRWQNDNHWPTTRAEFFKGIPPIINGLVSKLVRKNVVKALIGQGIGRHTQDEILVRAKTDITALADILSDQEFLFGSTPTSADISAIPMLRAAAFYPLENPLSNLVLENQTLLNYLERGKSAIYPQ